MTNTTATSVHHVEVDSLMRGCHRVRGKLGNKVVTVKTFKTPREANDFAKRVEAHNAGQYDAEVRAALNSIATEQVGVNLVAVPATFYDDHGERELPTPEEVKRAGNRVFIRADDEHMDSLVSDAEYYADGDNMDMCPRCYVDSARRTLKALQRAGVSLDALTNPARMRRLGIIQ